MKVNGYGDFVTLALLALVAVGLNFYVLHAFLMTIAVGGFVAWAIAYALLVDGTWTYMLYRLASGRAVTKEQRLIARTVMYTMLAVSVFTAVLFAATTFTGWLTFVAPLFYALPSLTVLGLELVITSTYMTVDKITVTRGLSVDKVTVPTGTPTVANGTDVVEVANRIINDVRDNGTKRPGWNRVAADYGLSQSKSRKVVSLVREAVGA